MLLDISGNTFSSLGNPQDANAMAFISAAGISNTTQITAIQNLVFDLKQNNIWNKMQAIYPFVGGTANSHKYNLKDPRDLDAAFRLSFTTGWTHNASGATPNGTSAYADTFYNLVSSATQNSHHISYYSRTNSNGTEVEIGALEGTDAFVSASRSFIEIRTGGVSYFAINNEGSATGFISFADANAIGFYVSNRTSASNFNAWKNGARSAFTTTTPVSKTPPNRKYFLGAYNVNNTPSFFSTKQCAFASIGSGLTDSEIVLFNTAVEAYQTTLGRQVISSTTISRSFVTAFTIPTVTYNPKQIYGNDLYVWVDMTDWRNMYNSQTGSTNIPSTGYVPATSATAPSNHTSVRRMEDMAGNFTGSNSSRKFYSISTLSDAILPESATTGTSQFSNVFNNNQLDSNKGIFSGTTIDSTNLRHVVNLTQPINFLARNSTLTICNYMYVSYAGTPAGNNYSLGITFPRFVTTPWLGFGGFANSSNLSFYLPSSSTSNSVNMWSNNWATSYAQFNNKTIMLTAVISGRGYDIYANNVLLTSGTIPTAVTYPFSAAGTTYQIGIGYQPAFGGFYQSSRPIWEGFIANSYTSPQQINLLYDYFRVKFKDRQGDLA